MGSSQIIALKSSFWHQTTTLRCCLTCLLPSKGEWYLTIFVLNYIKKILDHPIKLIMSYLRLWSIPSLFCCPSSNFSLLSTPWFVHRVYFWRQSPTCQFFTSVRWKPSDIFRNDVCSFIPAFLFYLLVFSFIFHVWIWVMLCLFNFLFRANLNLQGTGSCTNLVGEFSVQVGKDAFPNWKYYF